MADTPTTSDVLMAAARRLMKHGWTQGTLHDGDKSCAMGATEAATAALSQGRYLMTKADQVLTDWLGREYGVDSIPEWNDDPHRTVEDVVLALKRAATEGEA